MLHLGFVGATLADHGLLTLPGRVLMNRQPTVGGTDNRRATGLADKRRFEDTEQKVAIFGAALGGITVVILLAIFFAAG